MISVVVWSILAFVAVLLGFVASYFSLRTLRWVSVITALILAAAITRYGLIHPATKNSDLVSAFTSGVDRLIGALLQPLWPGHAVPSLGAIGRLVLAFLLLVGYRGLEGWSMHRQAPLLDTSALSDGKRRDELAAELKFRLSAMEIRAPSILPGGSRTNGLASIAEKSGVSAGGLAGAIIRFAGMLWPSPRRLQLRIWLESQPGAAATAGSKVTVQLSDPRTGGTVSTKTVAGGEINEAASMVAGYVGRQIFAMDPTTPPWCYGAADGRDLGAMLLARLERVYAECPDDVKESRQAQIGLLRRATGGSRAAGVVAYELAQLLDLDSQWMDALRLHAMSREQYPRFYRGRYRLAMSLEMIANPEHPPFDAQNTRQALDEILKILSRCGLAKLHSCLDHDISQPDAEGFCTLSQSLRLELLDIAARELRDVRRQLALWRVVWATFIRRNERAVWLPQWRLRHRQAFHDGVSWANCLSPCGRRSRGTRRGMRTWQLRWPAASAAAIAGECALDRWLMAGQQGNPPAAPIAGRPRGRRSAVTRNKVRWLPRQRHTASWQAAYNTACMYAALAGNGLADVESVVVSLERAVSNPHSEMERAYDWICRDADFTAVRHLPRFFDFVGEQRRMGGRPPAESTADRCQSAGHQRGRWPRAARRASKPCPA